MRKITECYLARFILYCEVHDVKDEIKAALFLTSVDGNVFETMQQECCPKLLPERTFEELQDTFIKLLDLGKIF